MNRMSLRRLQEKRGSVKVGEKNREEITPNHQYQVEEGGLQQEVAHL